MQFTAGDFAALLGVRELPRACAALAAGRDFSYERPVGAARERIVRQVREHIDSDKPTRVGQHRADIWESCWQENLDKFVRAGFDAEKLVPDFFKPEQPMRLQQDYVLPRNRKLGLDIAGRHFDFFQPDRALTLPGDSGVLTMAALEQVGARHAPFLEYLLRANPRICVNMEPLAELYDTAKLADDLALRYHRKRGYLDGFLTALRELAAKRRIEILDVRRFFFGSLYHEAYSYVAWRPLLEV